MIPTPTSSYGMPISMLQSLWECNRRNVGPRHFVSGFFYFFSALPLLDSRKLPTSLMRLPLRLPGDGFPSTPSRGVLHAFQPDFQVCVNGLRHGGFWSLLCLVISSRTRRRAAILRHSRGQSRARSGPPVENATIVISRGLITAIGKDVTIPPEAWVIEGKGLTVYPGPD